MADRSREPGERESGMYSLAMRVGRLLEAELRAPLSANDVEGFRQETRLALLSLKSPAVAVTILVGLDMMPVEFADKLIEMVRRDNSMIERNGMLVKQLNSGVGLQIGRIAREGLSKDRRSFDDKKVLADWLGQVLTEPEKARLAVILAGVEGG
jgi:hypothetical protein